MSVIHKHHRTGAGIMIRISLVTIAVLLLVSACNPAALQTGLGTLTAWIDAPLNGSTIPLAPYEIVAHASDPEQIKLIEITVEGEVLGAIENPNLDDLLLRAQLTWNPPAPGTYTIQARGQNGSGSWSNIARAQVTVQEEFQPPPNLEPLPTETPTIELISCEPEIIALMNTTCRQGPTTFHEPITYLLEGESAPILGGNQELDWWAVLPESQSEPCWVSGGTVELSCIPEEPEILESPPYITRVSPSHDEFYWGDNPLRSVTIQARCGGESPVTAVKLIYHLAGNSDWYNATMVSTGGGIWQAKIHAHSFDGYRMVDSELVEYYLQATNQAGLSTTSPVFQNLILKDSP